MEKIAVNVEHDINDLLLFYTPLMQGILAGVATLVGADKGKVDAALEVSLEVLINSLENSRDIKNKAG